MIRTLTPPEIVRALDRSIVGQERAKRAVAMAIRNRWRSQQAQLCTAGLLTTRNYLLTGPKGSGKSATVRRAAQAIDAPFARISLPQLVVPGAQVIERMLEALVECSLSGFATQDQAVDAVSRSAIFLIEGIDRLFPASQSDENQDDRLAAAQQSFFRLLTSPGFHTRYGDIPTGHLLIFAATQVPAGRVGDLSPDLQVLFPHRIDLDNLTDDDLQRILESEVSSPIHHYVALLAIEGLTLKFTPDALEAIALEAGEQNRKTDDIGARQLSVVIEGVLDELLFDPASAPQTNVTIDAGYVAARITVDGDDDDLADFIL